GYIVNRGGSEAEDGFSLSWEDGNIRVELQNTQSKKKVSCENAAPSDHEWHHIAFTWSRKEKVITTYIDGQPAQTTKQFTGTLGIPTQALNIGRNALHGGYFHGQITEVRIWEQARSQDEIEQTMKQRLEGNETGLIGYWPLDDKQATAKDRSGNQHNGTIQGATWEETELPVTAHRLWATGLEDYGYWYRWKQSLPQQSSNGKSFRRGRIWA
ncbi:MAG: LamG-like jellyroll fold domain-containing protein, partial [Cyanobacteria bacterium P01_F01_bin.86]